VAGRIAGLDGRNSAISARGHISDFDLQRRRCGGAGSVIARPVAATEEIIKIQTGSLDILRKQFELGQIAGADVAAVEATLAQAQATLPPLRKQLAVQRDLLTALIGRLPTRSRPRGSSSLRCNCRKICRSACRRNWSISARMCVRRKRSCTQRVRRSASRPLRCFRNSR